LATVIANSLQGRESLEEGIGKAISAAEPYAKSEQVLFFERQKLRRGLRRKRHSDRCVYRARARRSLPLNATS